MVSHGSLLQRVRTDHAVVDELFSEMALPRSPEGEGIVDVDLTVVEHEAPVTLVRLVQAHVQASSEVMYREAAASLDGGAALAQQAWAEHRTILEHVPVLQRAAPGSPEFVGALSGLAAEFPQHAGPEEEMLERLAAAVGEERMAALHDEYELVRAGVLLGDAVIPLDRVSRPALEGRAGSTDATPPPQEGVIP